MSEHFAGWLPCDNPNPHPGHDWIYTDPATGLRADARCDGNTRPEPEQPCCGDPLCPCRTTAEATS